MKEIEDFIREAARVRGIDSDIAIRVAKSEGGVDEYARIGKFDTGWSAWPFQLHSAMAGKPGVTNPTAGMGEGFAALTGWGFADPRAFRDSTRYALNRAKLNGWSAWYGAAAVGIGRWDGIDRNHPWDARSEVWGYEQPEEPVMPPKPRLRTTNAGVRLRDAPTVDGSTILATLPVKGTVVEALDERAWRAVRYGGQSGWMAEDFLEAAPAEEPPPTAGLSFDPDTPTYLQRNQFTCSVGSVIWMLRSIGIAVTPEEAHDAMVPQYVNSDVGLRDASGAGIVEVLRDHWGVVAENHSSVSFDDVAGWAGRQPVAIGLHSWGGAGMGHWSAVRGVNDAGDLVLANPGGTGATFGQQTLSRQQFDARGPAAAVVITGREP